MENTQVKLHSMISLQASQIASQEQLEKAGSIYNRTVEKYNFSKIRTIEDAVNNGSPSIAGARKILKQRGDDVALINHMLIGQVSLMVRSFNITRNMSLEQVRDFVKLLEEEHYYLRFSEIHYILREARLGKYGTTFEGLDGAKLMIWFNDYAKVRAKLFEQESFRQHDNDTASEKERRYSGFLDNLAKQTGYQNPEKEEIKSLKTAHEMAKIMTEDMRKADKITAAEKTSKSTSKK